MIDANVKVLLANADNLEKQVWLKLPFDVDEFNAAMREIGVAEKDDEIDFFDLVASGKEITEYTILSWESDFDCFSDDDFSDLFIASDIVERIEELEEWEGETVKALVQSGENITDAIDEAEDGDTQFYPDTTLKDLAEQFGDEDFFRPEYLLQHVDWESVARDLENEGYEEVNGGVLYRCS